jgi:DNA polymerase-3 subunit chi
MPPIRIDFYLLASEEDHARGLIACRLLEKAYIKGHKVYVLCKDKKDAEYIDELLWTFKEDSFIPHNLQGEGPEPPPPIQIGYEREPRGFNDILINLSDAIPSFYSKFKRVMELVPNVDVIKNQSRIRYKDYKAKGCELFVHQMGT